MDETSSPPRPRGPWRVWPVFVAYLVAFLVIFLGSAVLVFVVAAVRAPGAGVKGLVDAAMHFALSAPGILSAAAVSGGAFLAVAFATARLLGPNPVEQLRLGSSRATALGIIAAVIGTAALSVAAGAASDLVGARKEGGTMEEIASSVAHARPPVMLLAVVLLGLGPGIAEETFFRGLMQTRLVARFGRWPGIVFTAALFGLIHLDPVQGPLAFLLGVFLGWTAEVLGGIRPSIAAHAVNNAIFVAAACLGGAASETPGGGSRSGDIVAVAAGSVILGASVLVLRSPVASRS
jgi:membrane protease YdiL (CAAX protease family)